MCLYCVFCIVIFISTVGGNCINLTHFCDVGFVNVMLTGCGCLSDIHLIHHGDTGIFLFTAMDRTVQVSMHRCCKTIYISNKCSWNMKQITLCLVPGFSLYPYTLTYCYTVGYIRQLDLVKMKL